jgi:hypothetical protein
MMTAMLVTEEGDVDEAKERARVALKSMFTVRFDDGHRERIQLTMFLVQPAPSRPQRPPPA